MKLLLLTLVSRTLSIEHADMSTHIDPSTVTHDTIHDNARRLFALFNNHFALDYPTDEAHRDALLSFSRNLAHHNATHAKDMVHLDELLTYTDGYATYGLTSAFARDPTQPMKGFIRDTGFPEYDLSTRRDRLRHVWNRVKDSVWYYARVAHAAIVSAPAPPPAPRAGCTVIYTRTNPLQPLTNIPLSADLREFEVIGRVRNQKVCGCCWAMASAVVLEGMTRSTQEYFKTKPEVDDTFKNANFIASEQYIMNNSRSSINNFCEGGNYKITSMDYANGNIVQTVESEGHFPLRFADHEKNPPTIVPIRTPKVQKMLLPYDTTTVTSACKASLIKLLDKPQKPSPMTNGAVRQIKSFLARGIPVAAAMYTGADGPFSSRDFSNYKGGIFNKPCTKIGLDHQIVFAGYGFYQGVEVWIMRNSWGEQWGSYGHFYAPIGNNVLCSETYAYTDIPNYFPLNDSSAVDKTYSQRVSNPPSNYWKNKMRRGDSVALDRDPSPAPQASKGGDNELYRPMGEILPSSSSGSTGGSSIDGLPITRPSFSVTKIVAIVASLLGGAGVAGIISKFTCCKR